MPKVHFVKKARKDHGDVIKAGESYWWWKSAYGPKQISKHPPRPSQLTNSKMRDAYIARENLEDYLVSWAAAEDAFLQNPQSAIDDLLDQLNYTIECIEEVAYDYQCSADAIEIDGSPVKEACEEKAAALEEYASALANLAPEALVRRDDIDDDEWHRELRDHQSMILAETDAAVGSLEI